MSTLFTSGHVVDLILIVMAIEAAWLLTRKSRFGRDRMQILDVALAFLPGVCLLLALRVALTDGPWPWVAVAVTASFPFHLLDLARRRAR
jgi:hypothetical protein